MVKKATSYIRDGRAPIPEKEHISRVMRANKAANTKPEIRLRKELWKHNLRGYKLNWKKAPGRPDIVLQIKRSQYLYMVVFGIGVQGVILTCQKVILNFGIKNSVEIKKETTLSINNL